MRELHLVEQDNEDYAEYSANFGVFNKTKSGWVIQTYSFVLREKGTLIAGGRGHVYLGALEIRGLWVDEARRGDGIGSMLLRAIEQEARNRGASKAMLYTYSWQAEAFYKAHGYSEYARFDFPHGHCRIDMQKSM